ncbi:ATP-binding protein [Streptodolium elevatio]
MDIRLDGTVRSVRAARRRLRRFLDAVLAVPMAWEAVLVASELLSNASRHTPGPCRLTVRVDPDRIEIAVRDTAPDRLPAAAHAFPERHGLGIIAHVTGSPPRVRRVPGGAVTLACHTPAHSRETAACPTRSRSRSTRSARPTAR